MRDERSVSDLRFTTGHISTSLACNPFGPWHRNAAESLPVQVYVGTSAGAAPTEAFKSPTTVPSWMDRAECARPEHADVDFFPERKPGVVTQFAVEVARAVCARCPVQQECVEFAVTLSPILPGTWGGTSGADRRVYRRTGVVPHHDPGPTAHVQRPRLGRAAVRKRRNERLPIDIDYLALP